MPALFHVGISAVIEDGDGRILLLRRAATKDFGALEWEPVSGRLEAGESIEDAARREVLEETGLVVAALRPYSTFHFERLGIELVGIAFACQCTAGSPQLSDEHDAQRWLSQEQLGEIVLHERVRTSLELYWQWRQHFSHDLMQ